MKIRNQGIVQSEGSLRFLTASISGKTWRILSVKSGLTNDERFFIPDETLRAAVPLFDNVKVNVFEFSGQHFNHLPNGVVGSLPKGVARNVVGWIDNPRFEDLSSYGLDGYGITNDFHVTDDKMAASFANAWDMGNPELFGFSVDSKVEFTDGVIGGRRVKVVPEVKRLGSLDVVSHPNAGGDKGQFLRMVASFNKGERTMNFWQKIIKTLLGKFDQTDLAKAVRSTPSLAGVDADGLKDKDDSAVVASLTDHMAKDAVAKHPDVKEDKVSIPANVLSQIAEKSDIGDALKVVGESLQGDLLIVAEEKPADAPADPPADDKPADAPADPPADDKPADPPAGDKPADDGVKGQVKELASQLKTSREEIAKLAKVNSDAMVRNRLSLSQLPKAAQAMLENQLTSRVTTPDEVDRLVASQKEVLASMTESGEIIPLGSGVEVGRGETDKLQLALDMTLGGMDEARKSEYDGIEAFSGIREAYVSMTGDKNITGVIPKNRLALAALSDFPEALGNTLHRRVAKPYKYHSEVWRPLVNVVNYTDFKENKVVRMGDFDNLDTVADNAEYTAIALVNEEKITWTGFTKGNTFAITRKMIINDDVKMVTQFPDKLGHAAGRTVAQFVFDLILSYTSAINDTAIYDAAVLYHSTHGANFDDLALNSDNLSTMRVKMMNQTAKDSGEILGILPEFLIVPPDLEDTAMKITGSGTTKGDTDESDKNVHAGRWTVVMAPYLRGDLNNWYIMASPQSGDFIDIGFFNGQDTPELLIQDAPNVGEVFTHDRIKFKVRIEPGGAINDYRGFAAGLKS